MTDAKVIVYVAIDYTQYEGETFYGVFSSEERAREYMAGCNAPWSADIDAWVVDYPDEVPPKDESR